MNDVIPVLVYHSVAGDPPDERRWTVTPEQFSAHLDVIAGRSVPRAWAHERLRTPAFRRARRPRRLVAS